MGLEVGRMGLEPIHISELLQCVLNLLDVFSLLRARYARVIGWCGSYSDNGRRGSPGGDAAVELFSLPFPNLAKVVLGTDVAALKLRFPSVSPPSGWQGVGH
jgi:hypothetical protein